MLSHTNCSHPATSSARARCRKAVADAEALGYAIEAGSKVDYHVRYIRTDRRVGTFYTPEEAALAAQDDFRAITGQTPIIPDTVAAVARPSAIDIPHCELCGTTNVEDVDPFSNDGYTLCCNELIAHDARHCATRCAHR